MWLPYPDVLKMISRPTTQPQPLLSCFSPRSRLSSIWIKVLLSQLPDCGLFLLGCLLHGGLLLGALAILIRCNVFVGYSNGGWLATEHCEWLFVVVRLDAIN
jgi:hypothetical protein